MKQWFQIFTVCMLICSASVPEKIMAQDIHFSQYMHAPLNLNPAETGNFDGDYRFAGNHKRQWRSFANAYTTFSASADRSFIKSNDLQASAGVMINNDVAGDGDFGTLQFHLPLSLNYQKGNLLGSVGFSTAWVQHGFNFNAFYFGNQYTGESFDPAIPNNEAPEADRFSYFDFATGLMSEYQISDSLRIKAGVSAQHLSRPIKSFYRRDDVRLPLKWQLYMHGDYKLQDDVVLMPSMLFMQQGTYREFNIGGQIRFDINPLGLRSVYAGGMLRARDAGILLFGLDYNQIRFHVSYDINLSGLTTISRGRGGIELAIIYIFKKMNPDTNPPVRKCPDFI
ncbi:MAG: PorP/SprF family type IX secretion system membrane protein [Bacteroidales bacterium]